MRMTRLFAVLVAALCMLLVLPYAGAMSIQMDPISDAGTVAAASVNDNYPISAEDAKNSVRVFMNNLSLEPQMGTPGSTQVGNYYTLTIDSDSFSVNQNTGIVEFVHFESNAPKSAVMTLSRDEAYAKATEYADQKYDGFSGKSWKIVVDSVYSDYSYVKNETTQDWERVDWKAYDFVLREEKNHVLLPNIVHVRVNPATGAIVDYWGVDRLVTVELKNSITLAEATETTENYYGFDKSFSVRSSDAYLAVVTRYQNVENLAWVVKITGYWNDRYEETYYAVVDANDGSLIGNSWSGIWPESRLDYYFN